MSDDRFLRPLGPDTQDRIDGMGDDTAWDEAIVRVGAGTPADDDALRKKLIEKAVAVWRQRSDEQVTAPPAEHCAAIVDALLPTIRDRHTVDSSDEAIADIKTATLRQLMILELSKMTEERYEREPVTGKPVKYVRRRPEEIADALLPAIRDKYATSDPGGPDEGTLRRKLKASLEDHRHNGRIQVWETICRCSWGGLNDPIESLQAHQVENLMPAIGEYVDRVVTADRERIAGAIAARADEHDRELGRPVPRTRRALRLLGTSTGLRVAIRIVLRGGDPR